LNARIVVRAVALAPVRRRFNVRLRRTSTGDSESSWELPFDDPAGSSLDDCARRVIESSTGGPSLWIAQSRTTEQRAPDAGVPIVCVDYVAIVPVRSTNHDGEREAWFPVSKLPSVAGHDRAAIDRGLALLRSRAELEPVAFRLLPDSFTLTELQSAYELLIGHVLHKASFRRALFAAHLVEPIDEWRQEQRGRPARLYRYAPRTPRDMARGVRFDRLVH
jgi:hypothetical protein